MRGRRRRRMLVACSFSHCRSREIADLSFFQTGAQEGEVMETRPEAVVVSLSLLHVFLASSGR